MPKKHKRRGGHNRGQKSNWMYKGYKIEKRRDQYLVFYLEQPLSPKLAGVARTMDRAKEFIDDWKKEENSMTKKTKELSFDEYRKIDAINASYLTDIHLTSPREARHNLVSSKDTPSKRLGSAFHCAVLEPERFEKDYIAYDAPKRGKKWEEFEKEHSGKEIFSVGDFETVRAMAASVAEHRVAKALFEKGSAETSFVWGNRRHGVKCKARFDYIISNSTGSILVDLKSTKSINPRSFYTDFAKYGYSLKMAFYHDAVLEMFQTTKLDGVKMVATANKPPYCTAVFDVPDEVIRIGRIKYEAAIKTHLECTKSGMWPGPADDCEIPIFLPDWALPENEEETTITCNGERINLS
jgi:hypothetical protein